MENSDLSKLRIEADKRGAASGVRPKKRRLWLLVLVVLCALTLVYLTSMGFLIPAVEVQTAKVALVYPSRALTTLNASGYVVAQRKAAVSSKATGRLEKLNVEEGKQVREGDILAVLENNDLKASLEEAQAAQKVAQAALTNAEAELTDATLNFQRNTSLRGSGAVSVQAFDAAEARYKKAAASERSARFGIDRTEASLKVAEVNLEYSYIRAPFSGVILTKNADVGEVVAPFGASAMAKAAVVTMADMDSLMVEVDVAESSLEKVKVGGAAEIRLDAYPHDRFPGTVYMIVPTADRSKATVMTKVKFDKLDPKVLPEMSAKVAFLSRPLREDEHQSFLGIPISAVRDQGERKMVFRVIGDRMRSVPVKIGRAWNDIVEILEGLSEGDLVIFGSNKPLNDGRRIRVKE
jgi:RND family efflux transporter MFP subunit